MRAKTIDLPDHTRRRPAFACAVSHTMSLGVRFRKLKGATTNDHNPRTTENQSLIEKISGGAIYLFVNRKHDEISVDTRSCRFVIADT